MRKSGAESRLMSRGSNRSRRPPKKKIATTIFTTFASTIEPLLHNSSNQVTNLDARTPCNIKGGFKTVGHITTCKGRVQMLIGSPPIINFSPICSFLLM